MKIILIFFFLLFSSSKVFAKTVFSDMQPGLWGWYFFIYNNGQDLKGQPDIDFEKFEKPIIFNNDSKWINRVFLPNGTGPFPIVVIIPNCEKVDVQDLKIMEHTLKRGYAAIVFDPHRGFSNNCTMVGEGRAKPIGWSRIIKDSYDLAAYLGNFLVINKNRIYSVGGSQGGMIGGFLSSPGIKSLVAPNAPIRFRASSSLYGCALFPIGIDKNTNRNLTYIFNDMDRPLLWLIGEADTECLPAADIGIIKDFQERKLPIEYHAYKDAYHCWDCVNKNNLNRTLYYYGKPVSNLYRYDEIVTNDSIKRSLDFFDKHK